MPADTTGYPPEFAALLDNYNQEVTALMARLEAGKVTSATWTKEMQGLLAKYSQAARMLGMGEVKLLPAEVDAVRAWLNEQFKYLDGFETVISSAGGEYDPAWLPRAQMYGASTVTEYWEGKTSGLPLPAMPGQGTQCLCITTPESRITTLRGLIPIRDVVVGDLVLTHLGRWRKVLNTYLRLSRPTHQQAWVSTPWNTKVGCTSDHRFLTPDGWKQARYIDNSHDIIYNILHENILQIMRNTSGQSAQKCLVHEMSADLSLWETQGSSGSRVHFLWDESQGNNSMVRTKGRYSDGTSGSCSPSLEDLREVDFRLFCGQKERWSIFYLLSRLEWKNPLSVSLSMGLDSRTWANSRRLFDPSLEWQLFRRPIREFGDDCSARSCTQTHDRGSETENDRRIWQRIYRQNANGGKADLDMSAMWKDLSSLQAEWNFRPQVLLEGLLPLGTLLYDIEVEEDNSFVVEGLISHNSNCRCTWDIQWLDKAKGNCDAYWRLHPAEHCQTCETRAEMWAPVRIRNGDLQS